jgi:hypothetical protein
MSTHRPSIPPKKHVPVIIPVHPQKAQKKPLPKTRSLFTIAGESREIGCAKMGKNGQK